ncbi:FCD domain-containing protein [Alicyclobacillus tolerans]|nr:FCD domain-containing protein [Alicyclobacillus tolerans]
MARLEVNLDETARCLSSGDPENLIDLNSEFHTTILQASRNLRLQRINDEISALLRCYWMLVLRISPERIHMVADHREIFCKLQDVNGPGASLAMRQHIVKDLGIVRDRIDRVIETNWYLS